MNDESTGSRGPPVPESDSAAVSGSAHEWREIGLPKRQFSFTAAGRTGSTSWAAIRAALDPALRGCGLAVSYVTSPKYWPNSMSDPLRWPGYAMLAAEGGLRQLASHGILSIPTLESYLAVIELWVTPPLTDPKVDAPDQPHAWNTKVGFGKVQSRNTSSRSGPYREYHAPLVTEPEFAWIPKAILAALS